ncbi:MAG: hypothetical protein ACP5QY_00695 [Candidatus Hydrogenedens sp.]
MFYTEFLIAMVEDMFTGGLFFTPSEAVCKFLAVFGQNGTNWIGIECTHFL